MKEPIISNKSNYIDEWGNVRQDIQMFLYNLVFRCGGDPHSAFKLTYPNIDPSDKYRGTRFLWKILRYEKIRERHQLLQQEKANQSQMELEIRSVLNQLRSLGKFKEYNDLLKTYLTLIKGNGEVGMGGKSPDISDLEL